MIAIKYFNPTTMTEERIKELREKFYKECVTEIWPEQHEIHLDYEQVFQWIVDNVIKAKEEETPVKLKPVKKPFEIGLDTCNHSWKDYDHYYVCMHCGRRKD